MLTVESPRSLFDVLDTFERSACAEPLTGYLGERPALAAKKWTLRRVPLDSGTDWHQDGAFLGADIRAVNVWLALTHCGDDAPGLDVVAGRLDDIVPTGTEGALFDWSVGDPVVAARWPRRRRSSARSSRPGDAMLFDDMSCTAPRSAPEMPHERYAIESWFFAPSTIPTDQIPVVF